LPRLAERLSAAIRLPVEEARPLERLKISEDVGLSDEQLQEASHVITVAVGLALEE
jgi:hypothetical protein